MHWSQTLQLTEVHAEGEIGRVVTGGQPIIPGGSLQEKFRWLNDGNDGLRRMLVLEPRGSANGSTNLLFAADDPNNHFGFIVLQPDQAHAMSGSNAICVTTALLETGMVAMNEGETEVRLETAAGLVIARAMCDAGKCKSVTLSMPPSFVEALDVSIITEEFGPLTADIAFGGVFYAILDPAQIGLSIEPASARALSDAGMILKQRFNDALDVVHPENKDINGIAYVMFRSTDREGTVRTATTMWPGRLDRSPCGTGNSANLAVRVAREGLEEGTHYVSKSAIGSAFRIRHAGTTTVGNKKAVLPEVTGRGWIFGQRQVGVDPSDPFGAGFALSDTWGYDAGKI